VGVREIESSFFNVIEPYRRRQEKMRNVTRWLLAGALTLTPLAGVVGTASANTELVPAARLVAPYWDVRGGVDTFLMLTNVSGHDLQTPNEGIHLEFYDKTCARVNETIDLSAGDIDQLQLTVKPLLKGVLASDFGWVDIDVRDDDAAQNDPSLELNYLVGTVIVVDAAKDFAIAYPMASSIGSSVNGWHGTIVTRDSATTGAALAWNGTYEPYPSRLFVPMFLADGTDAASGQVFSTSLYVAPVANGNWAGPSVGPAVNGEAPGQAVGTETACSSGLGTCALDLAIVIWDGCEENVSAPKKAHYFQGTLTGLFTAQRMDRVNWTAAKCDPSHLVGNYAGLDEYSGGPTGWIDIINSTGETTTDESPFKRGMVGVLVGTVINTGNQFGDATRLWGDPEFSGRNGIYTQVNQVRMRLDDSSR
jgi:hypothetical protein